MKRLVVVLAIFAKTVTFSQTGEIIYKSRSLKVDNLERKRVKEISKELNLMTFKLIYNKNNSYFKKEKNIPINKLYHTLAEIVAGVRDAWYQNALNKEAIFNTKIKEKLYQVTGNGMAGWNITEENKTIEGYNCYKAERKELNKKFSTKNNKKYIVYTAWFTPEIPVPYGPVGNGGLPGLILQLERSNLVLFEAIKLTLNHNNVKVPLPKNAKKININEKVRLMRLARKVTPD